MNTIFCFLEALRILQTPMWTAYSVSDEDFWISKKAKNANKDGLFTTTLAVFSFHGSKNTNMNSVSTYWNKALWMVFLEGDKFSWMFSQMPLMTESLLKGHLWQKEHESTRFPRRQQHRINSGLFNPCTTYITVKLCQMRTIAYRNGRRASRGDKEQLPLAVLIS